MFVEDGRFRSVWDLFEMDYQRVALKFLKFLTEVLDSTNKFLTFLFELDNGLGQSFELRLVDVDKPVCIFYTLLLVHLSEGETSPPRFEHKAVLKIK